MRFFLFFFLLYCGVASANEYRTFTDQKGREIEARLIKYDSAQGKVQMERRNGTKSWVNPGILSEKDKKYIKEWQLEKQFLDPRVFVVTEEEESSGWKIEENGSGRKKKSLYYQLSLINNGTHAFNNIRVDYCIYSYKTVYGKKHVDTRSFRQHVERLDESETKSIRTSKLINIKDSVIDYQAGAVGVCFRITITKEDGSEIMREIRSPKVRDESKYPWKDYEDPEPGNQKPADEEAAMTMAPLLPEGAVSGQLTEKDVEKIAELYVKAWEERDYQLYFQLLAPMYSERLLKEDEFKRHSESIKSMDIVRVAGLNVQIKINLPQSGKTGGWLQILPSGQIKYLPTYFEHPVKIMFLSTSHLLNLTRADERSKKTRYYAYRRLKGRNIPLFGYTTDASQHDRKKSAEKILDWLIENGDTWDSTEPKVFLPEKQFKELVKKYKR